LALAEAHGIRTIAFPAISTGVYRFPLERAARIALGEVRAFLQTHTAIARVILCCFSAQDAAVYTEVAEELFQ
jgi:O-acetyl-ADP-ribose deacetylase (regulator of RNase III)